MSIPLCTPEDVALRLGVRYEGDQYDQVLSYCVDVSALIRTRRPMLDRWLTTGALTVDLVRAVACQVVARVLTTASTGGVGLRSETHPEYSYELTSSAAAGLNLTKAEITSLTPRAGRERPFSIQPT